MIIIGITGTLGAGKGTVVDYLVKEKGFKHYSVSGYIAQEVRKRSMIENRDSLRVVGNELRERFGPDYIIKKLYENAINNGSDSIIESIRNPSEAEYIKGRRNGFLISVDAEPEIRYKRIQLRGNEKDKISFSRFREQESTEMLASNPNNQNLSECMRMADFNIENNSTTNDLNRQVGEILNEIKKEIKNR